MRKIPLLVMALILGWLSVAQAQVWVDPYTPERWDAGSGTLPQQS